MPNRQINPLLCIPSPRNIKVVKECIDSLPYDKLWMKENFDEVQAYTILRNYFLEHKEYTHFVILPDDLLVPLSTLEKLIDDLKKKDYPVLSGICNFNSEKFKSYEVDTAVDANHKNGMDYLLQNEAPHRDHFVKSGQLKGIKKVLFSGFPITFIKREILEKIDFSNSKGRGLDAAFAVSLLNERIDQYVDFDARSLHLKGIENCEDISVLIQYQFDEDISTKVNTKKQVTPRLYLVKAGNKIEELDYAKYISV
ncbi:MAG: hypothetical protein R2685_10825 [Candidatus Nitrosocosmicus sp.]|nr:hypothetical protein [Candidatus Nitrosocosmicus sp.]